ncbi:SDR family oxidoreductase [Pimelobacter simplex]|uniref:SDR family oxidoreductase n=1 Tax=Nocardioides simplex TaxID=2045 RepID=UPI00214FEAF1|nr:SDR family oxidoreductase [Pimelobacter simplex]UUW88198.1 SDR family oxidoreductase [Pimelobacter simplex]UUW97703.1 SDR family oxidoreductase [Pimelobacter simplex]
MTRNVLIAGAGPGVSGSLARLYAADGGQVALLGAEEQVLAALRADVEAAGAEALTAVVDLTDDAATRAAVTRLAEQVGHLDVVHFNPSAYREKDPLSLTPDELLDDVRLGVGALLTVVQAARPFMGPGGRVSATGSMAADTPWHGAASLGVQKAGLQNLVRSLDRTLAGDGIRAVSVTVRGLLAKEGPFAPDNVAAALRAAIDQDEDSWQAEVPYSG